ncbi:MAG TPA: aldose 1-epimerase family protein [Acetobacteraceae bacterium]|nr:aldose 1-epimerase family protein [Acetobacteraceae bacterium]
MVENMRHEMTDGHISVTVQAQGGELCSLRDAQAGELLWQAGPAWPRHAPVLFPIVGRLRDDTLRHNGRSYRLTQHGFARDRLFAWEERDGTSCRLVLEDDAATRSVFPFAFRLELRYAVAGGMLRVGYRVVNTGDTALPASLGAHPAFCWPLAPGVAPEKHWLEFAVDEPASVRRLQEGLLRPDPEPTPIRGRVLPLEPALFATDALILDRPASRSLRYVAPGAVELELGWEGFTQLGLWSRAGGAFLCIEPWYGMADPVGFDGEFTDKPGVMLVAPGKSWEVGWWVRVGVG